MSNSGFLDTFSIRWFLFPPSLIWIAGCSGGASFSDFAGKLIPVSGKLMLDCEPLADDSPVPEGMTDADTEADGTKHVVPPMYLYPSTSPLKVGIKPGWESLFLEMKYHRGL